MKEKGIDWKIAALIIVLVLGGGSIIYQNITNNNTITQMGRDICGEKGEEFIDTLIVRGNRDYTITLCSINDKVNSYVFERPYFIFE